MLEIRVIYDNTSLRTDLQPDWGFSCLVRAGDTTVIFDTGSKEEIFSQNLSALKIDRSAIKTIFFSHDHSDHVGGVGALLGKSPVQCIMPASSGSTLGPKITALGGISLCVRDRTRLYPHLWSTGEIGEGIREQSLVIEKDQELILITGCAHPGIVTIAEKVLRDFGRAPTMIVGGLHFYKTPRAEVVRQVHRLKELGVHWIAPCHCTGDEAIQCIKSLWGQGFQQVGAGWFLYIST